MALAGYKFEWEAEAFEQTTRHGYTWDRMRDDLSRAVEVRKAMKGTDPTRIKLWWVPGMAVIGVSMVDACADGLGSLVAVISERLPRGYHVLYWREEPATKAERQDARVMFVLVTDDPTAKLNGSYEVTGRSARSYAIQCDPRRDTREVDAVAKTYLDIERVWNSYLTVAAAPKTTAPRPPTGYVCSREFGAGQVVCVNGSEVTIDTERGRKTFQWTPPHDRAATPAEVSRVSATLAHRTALLCRERWATDGFGRPTAKFVDACGVVAATWVEQGRDALPVSELLSCVRGLVGVA